MVDMRVWYVWGVWTYESRCLERAPVAARYLGNIRRNHDAAFDSPQ
jgi:hypothetical protein